MRARRLGFGLVLGVLIAAGVTNAQARDVWLDYTDGPAVYDCDRHTTQVVMYFTRFTAESDAVIKRVWLRTEGAGELELHAWPDLGDGPDVTRELITPMTITTEDGEKPQAVEVSGGVPIAAGLSFDIGLERLTPEGAALCMDATVNNARRSQYLQNGGTEATDNGRDWMLRAQVDYTNEPTKFYFENVTEASGVTPGSRVAVADVDGDGDLDLLFSGSSLWANDGTGVFSDISAASGLSGIPSNGGLFADFDNDGDLDLYAMVNSLTEYDRLLRNDAGVFTDITTDALVEADRDLWPTEGAGWGDYDGDGYLDLYLANYEMPGEDLAYGTPDRLYHNNGDGTFTDVAADLDIDPETNLGDRLCGRGVNWGDFNDDGHPDIYVSNYRLDPNYLWVNNGDGTFTDRAEELGVQGNGVNGAWGHTIGSAWGDFNNDGELDLFNANLAHPRYAGFSDPSAVLINNGPPTYDFTDASADWQLLFVETHSDPSLGDWNNDGWLDLLITDVYEGFLQQLYRNNGDGTFSEVSYWSGLAIDNGWGAVFADIDGDGWLDVVSNQGLYRSTLGEWDDYAGKHWLNVRLECTTGDPFCVGGRITVQLTADSGPQAREVTDGKGTTQGDDFTQHFGLNECATAWMVTARFPSGAVVTRYEVPADSTVVITDTDTSDTEPESPSEDGSCALVSYPVPDWPPGDDDDDVSDDDDTGGGDDDDDAADDDTGGDDDDDDDGGCCG